MNPDATPRLLLLSHQLLRRPLRRPHRPASGQAQIEWVEVHASVPSFPSRRQLQVDQREAVTEIDQISLPPLVRLEVIQGKSCQVEEVEMGLDHI